VRGSFPARPKHSKGGLRQPPPTNKKISRHFAKLPLQSLPDYVIPVRTGTGGQAGLPREAVFSRQT